MAMDDPAGHTIFSVDLHRLFTQRQRRIIGNALHLIATQFFLLAVAILFLTWMEVWKGVELLDRVRNAWFSFGGARELLGYVIIIFVVGRLLDVLAKRFEPRLKHNPERGWHYRDR
jgi:hypothetical protein